jgi:hypothetical protein
MVYESSGLTVLSCIIVITTPWCQYLALTWITSYKYSLNDELLETNGDLF